MAWVAGVDGGDGGGQRGWRGLRAESGSGELQALWTGGRRRGWRGRRSRSDVRSRKVVECEAELVAPPSYCIANRFTRDWAVQRALSSVAVAGLQRHVHIHLPCSVLTSTSSLNYLLAQWVGWRLRGFGISCWGVRQGTIGSDGVVVHSSMERRYVHNTKDCGIMM
uniref:Uncharacterized protein n=1 Tax=Oryza sativa subsp. indica TaxID=39946 RepID=A0A679B974_ORYSI|nr:hypothetical protein [Oryza sativa Indica Group]